MLPIEDHPSAVVLPIFGPPGITVDAIPEPGWPQGRLHSWRVEQNKDIITKYVGHNDWSEVDTIHRFELGPFAQLLAKIAHCYCVVSYGLDGFNSFMPDLINGKDINFGYLVGSDLDLSLSSQIDGHEVSFYEDPRGYICCAIRLFPIPGNTPLYRVVVGTPNRDKMDGYWQEAQLQRTLE
jgi:hypothetical protein